MKHLRFALLLLLLQALAVVAFAQQDVTDSLLNIVRQNKRDKQEAVTLNALAFSFSRTDIRRGLAYLHEAIAVSLEAGLNGQLSEAFGQMVISQQDFGRADSALFFLGKLKKLAETFPAAIRNYSHAAGLYYKRRNDYRSALPFQLESLQEATEDAKGDSSVTHLTNLAGAYLNVGNTETGMGDYKSAQRYHLQALGLFEKAGNKKGISYACQAIGGNFLNLHQLRQAADYTGKALELKKAIGDTRGVASSQEQLASIFRADRRYDSAQKYNLLALETNQRLGLKVEEESLDMEIGDVYRTMNNDSAAIRYFERGRALALSRGDSIRLAAFDAALIAVRKNGDDLRVTEQRLLNSINTEMKANDIADLLVTYTHLADHYAKTGQTKKAIEYQKKYFDLKDSLGDMNTQIQLKKMEGQYNIEKKEQEIALLKKDQQLTHINLERQKADLAAQDAMLAKQKFIEYGIAILLILLILIGFLVINRYRIVQRTRRTVELEKMRNHIARDLHDDVGSTLSSINILSKIALQSHSGDSSRSSLEKISGRSAAIMEKMGDIVWTINPQNDTMEQLLYRMKEFAAETLEPLNISYSFHEEGDFTAVRLDLGKRKDLYLVFKESVGNASRSGQCTNLVIHLLLVGDSLKMKIADEINGLITETIMPLTQKQQP